MEAEELKFNTPFENADVRFMVRFKVAYFDGNTLVPRFYAIAPQHTKKTAGLPWNTSSVIGTSMDECVECFPDKKIVVSHDPVSDETVSPRTCTEDSICALSAGRTITMSASCIDGVQFSPDVPIHINTRCIVHYPDKKHPSDERVDIYESDDDGENNTKERKKEILDDDPEPCVFTKKMCFSASFLNSKRTLTDLRYKNRNPASSESLSGGAAAPKYYLFTMNPSVEVCIVASKGSNNYTIREMFFSPSVCKPDPGWACACGTPV